MTKKLIAGNVALTLALMLAVASYAQAAEVTGSLTAGAVDPGAGSISGTVSGGGSGSLTGTVSSGGGSGGGSSSGGGGGSSSGGGGGGGNNNPPGSVLGASTSVFPGFPNAGAAPLGESAPWTLGTLSALFMALGYGAWKKMNSVQ
jgi:hypothetical protein